jgi:hypothetical protein
MGIFIRIFTLKPNRPSRFTPTSLTSSTPCIAYMLMIMHNLLFLNVLKRNVYTMCRSSQIPQTMVYDMIVTSKSVSICVCFNWLIIEVLFLIENLLYNGIMWYISEENNVINTTSIQKKSCNINTLAIIHTW